MKCVLLAAGYATRLYPLTINMPKSLLLVGDKTILEHILAKVEEVPDVDEVILVTNSKFAEQFKIFVTAHSGMKPIVVIDDGTEDNDHRLGAIADLSLAVECARINDDILVLAGDNLFNFTLKDFVTYFHSVRTNCITTYEEKSLEALRTTGVIELSADNRVLSFEEKPHEPKANNAVPPFYLYTRETLPLIKRFLEAGENADAPGQFVHWLVREKTVYAFRFTGRRYDIGSLVSYEEAKRVFESKD